MRSYLRYFEEEYRLFNEAVLQGLNSTIPYIPSIHMEFSIITFMWERYSYILLTKSNSKHSHTCMSCVYLNICIWRFLREVMNEFWTNPCKITNQGSGQ